MVGFKSKYSVLIGLNEGNLTNENPQIRLADGTRLVAKFNHSHTISDVRNFINLSRPGNHTNYNLMTTFPNKVIDNEMETLQQAGLLNAVIVQRRI